MANYAPGEVFDLGAVYRNVSEMQNRNALTRNRLDPNSMENQLYAAKIRDYERSALNPGGAASYNKNPTFVRSPDGKGGWVIKAFQLNDKGTAPIEVNFGPDALPAIKGSWVDVGDGKQLLMPYDTSGASPISEPPAGQGATGQPAVTEQPATTTFIPEGVAEVDTPEHRAEVVRQQEQAKVEVEAQSPAEQKKQQMREADAANAKTLISDMLAPRKDGKGIYATYAYGRANVMTPDLVKPQEWIDAEAKRNQLVSMMQLENVAKLKGTGPITEPEQKVLRQAMTVLENPLISAELVEREMKRVMVMFTRWEKEAKAMQGKENPDESYEQRRARILGK